MINESSIEQVHVSTSGIVKIPIKYLKKKFSILNYHMHTSNAYVVVEVLKKQ